MAFFLFPYFCFTASKAVRIALCQFQSLNFPAMQQLFSLFNFSAFILLCGTTHLMEIWAIWYPDYAAQGVLKAMTAAVSILAAGGAEDYCQGAQAAQSRGTGQAERGKI
ncbi:MAG: hypothetical protein K2Q01_08040 [Rickettsiales bacterium]|nr:hypothetical protein [Rickettsiales bacterium]